eukprot:5533593-Ditylum_brightwellii.AAC.1
MSAFVDLSGGAGHRTHHVLHSRSISVTPYSLTHLRQDLKKRGDNKGKTKTSPNPGVGFCCHFISRIKNSKVSILWALSLHTN